MYNIDTSLRETLLFKNRLIVIEQLQLEIAN